MEGAIVLVTLVVTTINVLAVMLGRGREINAARIAFASGLVALATFPMSLVAALLSFVPAPLDSPAPMLLFLFLGVLAGATLCSAAMLVPLFRNTGSGPNDSSKPTPLRGAA